MPNHETQGAQARPVWMFMAATAMATTVSTLAATAMVKAESSEPAAVTCACEAPTPVVVPSATAPTPEAPPPARAEPAEPAIQAEDVEQVEQAEQPEPAIQTADPLQRRKPVPKAKVDGNLDKDLVRRIVRAHIGEVRDCYNEGLKQDPELSGLVTVDFVIGVDGKVARSKAHSDDIEGEVPECIAEAVNRWLFPRSVDGEEVAVTYPFVLEPG